MKLPEFSWPGSDGEYDDELLLEIESGIVSYLVRGRNAWHSTWVRHEFLNTRLFRDVVSAKKGAEPLRERGNVFYIQETPALLLRGPTLGVILCDHYVVNPFGNFTGLEPKLHEDPDGKWVEGIYPGVSLRDAELCLSDTARFWGDSWKEPDSLLKSVVKAGYTFAPRSGELVSLTSYPQGTDYFLGWMKNSASKTFQQDGVRGIVDAWTAAVAEAASFAPEDTSSRADQFVHYRESVLIATPVSIWRAQQKAARMSARAARAMELDAWASARDKEQELRNALALAQNELGEAKADRLKPADSSEGIRAQRERLELAEQQVEHLIEAVEQAREVALQALRELGYGTSEDGSS